MAEPVPIDPSNPGEVLACAGLTWLVAREAPEAECGFEPAGGNWYFHAPFQPRALTELVAEDPQEGAQEVMLGDLRLDWWQPDYGLNPGFKFWAGQQSPRSVLTNLVRAARAGDPAAWPSEQTPTTGRLGVDPQGTWDSLRLGWSVNEHSHLQHLCRPYVELLAFLALQRFPVQGDRETGFRYALWAPAPLTLAPLAFAGTSRLSQGMWQTEIEDAGSNKYLKPAYFIGG